MRQTLLFLTIIVTIIACNSSDKTNVTSDTVAYQVDTAKSTRHILIEELKKLRQIIVSNDKEKIAGLFTFPLSDTSFSIYVDDSTFNEQFKANGGKTTKQMFLNHFKQISESIWIDPLITLLNRIPLDSVMQKDRLERDGYNKKEPCYYSYKLEIIKDSIVLRMDMNSNRTYESKKTSEDDIPENSSEICEHSFWWNFYFDGRKLYFKSIGGAD
jgi:hypothetical protein